MSSLFMNTLTLALFAILSGRVGVWSRGQSGPGASLVPGPETEVHLFRTGMAE